MKIYFIFIIFITTTFCSCLNANSAINDNLVSKMYDYFTSTLQKEYGIDSEAELYKKFLSDFLNGRTYLSDLDTMQLNSICNELFKRDINHYYLFYPELIIINEDYNSSKVHDFFVEKYPNTPIIIIQIKESNNSKGYKDSHITFINNSDGSFLNSLSTSDYFSIKAINETINQFKELNTLDVANLYVNGKGLGDLEIKEVRQVIAMIYWKYLCSKSNIDFYKSNDPQKRMFIDEFLKSSK